MKIYTQLTSEQRYQIYALLKKNHTQTDIAQIIGVHKSTVSRELKRNTGGARISAQTSPQQGAGAKRRESMVWGKWIYMATCRAAVARVLEPRASVLVAV